MQVKRALLAPAAFTCAALVAILGAHWASDAIEARSAAAVKSQLLGDGITFASVEADGLEVWMTGTAPNEAARFRAVNLAGSVIDAARIRDGLEVTPVRAIEAPRFSVEMLRNDDGISLIGLLPEATGETALAEAAAGLANGLEIADMLETAAFPAPEGWDAALAYGLEALKLLPRSKISVAADRVAITAISDSEAEKRRLEAELSRRAPAGLQVAIDISAPRPVLTPFTLRFVKDEAGARFDACSADTTRARDRILAAGATAGVEGKTQCTVGLGVPTPRWSDATIAGIKAVTALGAGSITFSDADVSLLATVDTPQSVFDTVVGELQTALPPVFSLNATLPPKPSAVQQGPAEFTATLSEDGQVQLRGRLTDPVLRAAVDSYARAQFGASRVYTATRLDEDLPDGWPVRVLAGLESLAELTSGTLLVRADTVEVAGVTGSQAARGRISQVLSDKLGQGQTFKVSVRYDEALDPLAALPTPDECVALVNASLKGQKITFTPGSAEIAANAGATLDALANVLGECPDVKFVVGGYTDSQGSEDGNRALSQARAEAVVLALQGRRVAVTALTALGFGEARPIADNATEAGREANRRIEFTPVDLPVKTAPPVVQSPGSEDSVADAAGETPPVAEATTSPDATVAATAAPGGTAPEDGVAEGGLVTDGAVADGAVADTVLPDGGVIVPEGDGVPADGLAPAAIATAETAAPADPAAAGATDPAAEAPAAIAAPAAGTVAPDAAAAPADDGPSFAPTENTVKPLRRPETE